MNKNKRIYIKDLSINDEILFLKGDNYNYIKKVQRAKVGYNLNVFNELAQYQAVIEEINNKEIKLRVLKKQKDYKRKKEVIIVASVIKPTNQKFLVQKLAEIGVSKLVFTNYKHTNNKLLELEKLKEISIRATEQSNNCIPLEIIYEKNYKEALNKEYIKNTNLYIAHKSDANEIQNKINNNINSSTIIIGSEGGFTEEELDYIITEKKAFKISLIDSILKVETAAICSSYLFLRSVH